MKAKPRPSAGQSDHAAAPPAGVAPPHLVRRLFPVLAGLFCGLCLLKFGNPAIMERWVDTPSNIYEFVFGYPWPLRWAYWMTGVLALAGLACVRKSACVPNALVWLPALWLAWQCLSAFHSVDSSLTRMTLPHLACCVVFYYLGLFALGGCPAQNRFWAGLSAGFLLAAAAAWSQHFGGLEETRKYFWTYIYPTLETAPVDYMRKISSNRVFGTLFYPNTLAAAVILLFPALTAKVWSWTGHGRFTAPARWFILIAWSSIGAACLLWSGSKGGWLVMMLVALIGFFRWPGIAPRLRVAVAAVLVLCGLGAFFWTYSAFFKKGAPSVGARFDYWRAASQNVNLRPAFGSGPGTFAIPYKELKAEESEMSRLAHNDYLQQASDSGLPALAGYGALVFLTLRAGLRKTRLPDAPAASDALLPFAVWLGLAGWFLHSVIEFNLYIPALAWTAFLLLGWLMGIKHPEADAGCRPAPTAR
jgi:O-antigen ligase